VVHVGAFVIYFNVKNFNVLKQIYCALVGLIKDWITSKCTVQLWGEKNKIKISIEFKKKIKTTCSKRIKDDLTLILLMWRIW
jgi:hypothetical protein